MWIVYRGGGKKHMLILTSVQNTPMPGETKMWDRRRQNVNSWYPYIYWSGTSILSSTIGNNAAAPTEHALHPWKGRQSGGLGEVRMNIFTGPCVGLLVASGSHWTYTKERKEAGQVSKRGERNLTHAGVAGISSPPSTCPNTHPALPLPAHDTPQLPTCNEQQSLREAAATLATLLVTICSSDSESCEWPSICTSIKDLTLPDL